jgi:hypothetical protein
MMHILFRIKKGTVNYDFRTIKINNKMYQDTDIDENYG